jgi:hypothetical protein
MAGEAMALAPFLYADKRRPGQMARTLTAGVEALARSSRVYPGFAALIEQLLNEAILQMRRSWLPARPERRRRSLWSLSALGAAGYQWVNDPDAFEDGDLTANKFLRNASDARYPELPRAGCGSSEVSRGNPQRSEDTRSDGGA